MNVLGVQYSVVGFFFSLFILLLILTHCSNHDWDFGLGIFDKLIKGTKAAWILSNVVDKDTNGPFFSCTRYEIVEIGGWKIGLIGIVEKDWVSTLSFDTSHLEFLDMVNTSKELCQTLKEKEKVDFVVALTHSRETNDIVLAKNVKDISLILGGHDHYIVNRKVRKTKNQKFCQKLTFDIQGEWDPHFEEWSGFQVSLPGEDF